jgi:hypothetical protein
MYEIKEKRATMFKKVQRAIGIELSHAHTRAHVDMDGNVVDCGAERKAPAQGGIRERHHLRGILIGRGRSH